MIAVAVIVFAIGIIAFAYNAWRAYKDYDNLDTHKMIWHLAWMIYFGLCVFK